MLPTNRQFFAKKTVPNSEPKPQAIMPIPKWKDIPDWDIVIQTHPLQSIPLHPPWGADKGPIYTINYPESKYIFFLPENGPQRMQKRETVSGHLGITDYDVSHIVDTCL